MKPNKQYLHLAVLPCSKRKLLKLLDARTKPKSKEIFYASITSKRRARKTYVTSLRNPNSPDLQKTTVLH